MNPPDRQSLPPAPSGWIAKIEAYALDSGAFVSFMAASLTASTSWVCGATLAPAVVGLAATATGAVYGLDRLLDRAPADACNVPARTAWVERYRPWLWLQVALCALASLGLAWALPARAQWTLFALGVCTGVYGLRLVPSLRRWATPVKPVAIGVLWAGGSVWVPCAAAGLSMSPLGWSVFAARCLHVVCGCLLFDLRDLEGDRASGERSWAVRWGRRRTLLACWLLVGGAALTLGLGVAAELPRRAAPDLVTSAAFAALLVAPRVDQRRYCALGVDGALGLPGLVAAALAWIA